jgi:uncharacterized membrane protein SpoIIM required for sporulation
MVIESIVNPTSAKKHYLFLFLVGFVYATLGLFLAYWIFRNQASLVMVLFVVLAAVPLFYNTMKQEEGKILTVSSERDLLRSHAGVLKFFVFFFLGMSIAFSMWYVVLPGPWTHSLFSIQQQTISNLNHQVTGHLTQVSIFSRIFLNNLKVMIFSLLFSFLFGSGAIFILTWNASVIGAAAGSFFKANLAQSIANPSVAVYIYLAGLSALRYAIHGVPEILAYFVGGLAGGILSVAVIRQDIRRDAERVLLDFSDLVIIAVLFLFIAGVLEVFVTPLFFSVL